MRYDFFKPHFISVVLKKYLGFVLCGYLLVITLCCVCVGGGQPLEQDCQDGVPSRVGQGLNPLSLFPHLSKRTVRVVTSWDFGSSENFGLDDACKACIPHTPRWDSRPWTSEDFTVVCL